MLGCVLCLMIGLVVGAAFGCGATLWGMAGSESFVDRDDS